MDSKKSVEKAVRFVEDKHLAFFTELSSLSDSLAEANEKLTPLIGLDLRGVERLKGEQGEQGEQGIQGEQGYDGEQGEKGNQGDPGIQGIPGIQGEAGINGRDGRDGRSGTNGKDGSPDSPEQVRDKLVILKGEDRLPLSAVKGLEKAIFDGKKGFNMNDQRWHGAGITSILAGSNITVVQGSTSSTVTINSTGGGISGSYVATLNGLSGSVALVGSTNVVITPVGNTLQISASGGGGTPASPNTAVQFNTSGAFDGSDNLTWDNTNANLQIKGGIGGGILFGEGGDTSNYVITAANQIAGFTDGIGVGLLSGNGYDTGKGGDQLFQAGNGGDTGNGGDGYFQAGNGGPSGGDGGNFFTTAGGQQGGAGGKGGDYKVYGGDGNTGNASGGDVWLTPGKKSGAGTVGHIKLFPDSINNTAPVVLDLSALTTSRNVAFQDASGTVAFLSDITGGDITVDSTVINDGTDTRILFDNAGLLGEDVGLSYDLVGHAIILGVEDDFCSVTGKSATSSGAKGATVSVIGGAGAIDGGGDGGDVYLTPGYSGDDSTQGNIYLSGFGGDIKLNLAEITSTRTYELFDVNGAVPTIVAKALLSGGTGADEVVSYSVSSEEESTHAFLVCANVNILSGSNFDFGVVVSYEDETETSRVLTIPMVQLDGTITPSITDAAGLVPHSGVSTMIRCVDPSLIVMSTSGTFTDVTYAVAGTITRVI